MNKETLQAIGETAQEINKENGWGAMKNFKRFIALTVSELSEMLEADRRNRWSKNIIKSFTCKDGSAIYGLGIAQAHQFIINTEHYVPWFTSIVKDTVEDELADVVIRITSCLASLDLTIGDKDYSVLPHGILRQLKEHAIPENVYDLTKLLVECDNVAYMDGIKRLENIAYLCFDYADFLDIDLEWHIAAKLTYNKTRPYRHGKSY